MKCSNLLIPVGIIWIELYKLIDGLSKHSIMYDIHYPMFSAMYHAHIHYTIIIISDLYRPKQNHYSIKKLLDLASEEGRIAESKYSLCINALDKLSPIIKKIGNLRGNHFGHKKSDINISTLLLNLKFKNKDLGQLLEQGFWIVSQLTSDLGGKDLNNNLEIQINESIVLIFEALQLKFDNTYSSKLS